MRKFIALSCLFLSLAVSAQEAQVVFKGTVVKVRDGDTIVLHDKTILRLSLVDAPEFNPAKPYAAQPYGEYCQHLTASTVLNKQISYTVVGTSYDRKVASVFVPGTGDLGEVLLKSGCAWLDLRYKQGTKSYIYTYKNLLAEAQESKVGLWQDAEPIEPHIWRKK